MSCMLSCQNLVFARSNAFRLEIDRLDINSGLLYAIEGPNGAGKTTLLWLLAGLLRPQKGTIKAFGEELTAKSSAALRRMTLVMEEPYLLRRSVQQNVEYGLARRGIGRNERERRAAEALIQVRMERHAKRMAAQLSEGERKRVAFARALALKPEVLLLDEPTSHVDQQSVGLIEDIIERLRKHTTIVISTHDLSQSRRLADKTFTLLDGRLSDITHENLLEVRAVIRDNQRFAVLSPGWEIPIKPGEEGLISILVDPDKIRVGPAQSDLPSLVVTSLAIERDMLRIRLDGKPRLVARMSPDEPSSRDITVGQDVSVTVPTEATKVLTKPNNFRG